MTVKKTLEKVAIGTLKEYARNNKHHQDYDVEKIMLSIQKSTYISPIIVDEDNVIINGHGRKMALERLGVKEVDVLRLQGLTDKQKNTARLLDNKVAEFAMDNIENIRLELDEIQDEDLFNIFEMAKEVDLGQIYQGMPEFDNVDQTPEFRVIVNFQTAEDKIAFGNLIGQVFTVKTDSVWFPMKEREVLKDKGYFTE